MGRTLQFLLDNLRTEFEQIQSVNSLLGQRLKLELENVSQLSYLTIFIGTLASLLIFLGVIFRLNFAASELEQAEQNLLASLVARARLTEPFGYLLKPFSKKALKASIEMGLYKSEMERKQQRILDGVVQAIAELVKLHNPFLHDAQIRAAELAAAIATELHLPAQEVNCIRLAAMLHGIGMVAMSTDLFDSRRTPLQGVVKEFFETHPEIAYRLLKGIEFPCPVAEMVRQHMERLDGSGFPRGLKGQAILPGARVVAVACAVATLLRPHGVEAAASVEDALKEIEAGSGALFDPEAVKACVRLFREKGFAFHG